MNRFDRKSGDKKRFEPFRNQSKPFTSQALCTGRPAKSRMVNAENQNPGMPRRDRSPS